MSMNNNTIVRNTPTMPTKVAFYNSLVAFYNSTTDSGIALNAEQMRAVRAVNDFESGNIHIYYKYNVTTIDKSVVEKLTPKHHRKRNLYRILVAFFDASLALATDANAEECEDKDTLVELLDVVIKGNNKDMLNVVFFEYRNDVQEKAKVIEQKKSTPKKRYGVSVHAVYVFDTEVIASSEEEAKAIAYRRAMDSSNDEWEFCDYMDKGEVYDVYDDVED